MLIIDSFGKNVYIGDDLVGYIGENCIYINGHKFADLSDDGVISYGEVKVGYVDETNSIIVNNNEVGYIDDKNNFVFYRGIKLK